MGAEPSQATEESIRAEVECVAKAVRDAAPVLAQAPTAKKDEALQAIADALDSRRAQVLQANERDLEGGRQAGLSKALLDRLALSDKRIEGIIEGVRQVIALRDPVGEIVAGWRRPNGLEIRQVRVPLGVVGIIYEARPNVTVDVVALCLKAGNAVLLRGGKEAINSNTTLVEIMREAIVSTGLPADSVQLIRNTDRASARAMMGLIGYLDVLVPRGGHSLIRTVVENAKVPVIETGEGNCHIYVDHDADLKMAEEVVLNAKTQRPSICNAVETLLVHRDIAPAFLPAACRRLAQAGVETRGCPETLRLFPQAKPATEEDWATEYLDLILAVKVVRDVDEAIAHIARYSTRNSEAIISNDHDNIRKFTQQVDSAAVFVNASTRFTDGFEFGLGAELGVSTQKLHVRGPVGLPALTSTKYVVVGTGQVRT